MSCEHLLPGRLIRYEPWTVVVRAPHLDMCREHSVAEAPNLDVSREHLLPERLISIWAVNTYLLLHRHTDWWNGKTNLLMFIYLNTCCQSASSRYEPWTLVAGAPHLDMSCEHLLPGRLIRYEPWTVVVRAPHLDMCREHLLPKRLISMWAVNTCCQSASSRYELWTLTCCCTDTLTGETGRQTYLCLFI